jgi:hypothetical protein
VGIGGSVIRPWNPIDSVWSFIYILAGSYHRWMTAGQTLLKIW